MGNAFDTAHEVNQDILAGTMLAVGLVITFFGSKLFKQIIFFVGFLLGGLMTYYAVPILFGWFGEKIADDTLLYMSLTVGALCGILLVVVYKVAVFTCGAVAGAILSQIIWITVIAIIDAPEKDYMVAIQITILVIFALIGGYLAFKFVEQVLKAVTAFIGGFIFSSGVAYFIARIAGGKHKNIIDWVVFFGASKNYNNFEDVCDAFCIVCILLWLTLFAAGCFVQYKLHKKHRRKEYDENDSDTEYDSDDSYSGRSSRHHKKKKRRHSSLSEGDDFDKRSNRYYEPNAPSYAGSVRIQGQSVGSHSSQGQRPEMAPTIAMSNYGQNYISPQQPQSTQYAPSRLGPGVAHSMQHGDYGQRTAVQYV